MKTLDFPDRHYLNSALGWLELGNAPEARAEMEQISLLGRAHFDTFAVRWQIAASAGDWAQALTLARAFTLVCPHEPRGWLFHAYALFVSGRRLEASLLLVPKLSQFPHEPALPHLLASFAAAQGNHRLADHYHARATALGSTETRPDTLPAFEDLGTLAGAEWTRPIGKSALNTPA